MHLQSTVHPSTSHAMPSAVPEKAKLCVGAVLSLRDGKVIDQGGDGEVLKSFP